MLQVIAGPDPKDPTSLPAQSFPLDVVTNSSADGGGWALNLTPKHGRKLRIGVDAAYNSIDVDQELSTAVAEAIGTLEAECDCEIVPVNMPAGAKLARYLDSWAVLCAPEALAVHRASGCWPSKKDLYGSWFRTWLELGEKISGEQYALAQMERQNCVGNLNTLFADNALDALACPNMLAPPHATWNGGPDLRATHPDLILTDVPEVRPSLMLTHTADFFAHCFDHRAT
eukprot:SAG31_NODE_7246_length_1744_cov_1.779331_1_plen_229_part_00